MRNMLAARYWTEVDSLPGKVAPVEQATDICNTLWTDSSVVFVTRHPMEVSPLSWRTRSSLSTALHSSLRLLHPPLPAILSADLTARFPFRENDGLTTFRLCTRTG